LTRVVERKQVVLYPLRQMKTEPALSTQILTGLFVHQRNPLETTTSGPMSSKADIILPSSLQVFDLPPKLIFLDQGRKVHQSSFTAPTPLPQSLDPPAASVYMSIAQGGKPASGSGIGARPEHNLSIDSQNHNWCFISGVMHTK